MCYVKNVWLLAERVMINNWRVNCTQRRGDTENGKLIGLRKCILSKIINYYKMDKELLFVYGTLRRGFVNPVRIKMEENAVFHGVAVMQGQLFEIHHYPGAVLSDNPDDMVHGEVYIIRDQHTLFSILDEYEESSADFPTPQEYARKEVIITLENGKKVQAWTYLYNWNLHKKTRIHSGDYLKNRNES